MELKLVIIKRKETNFNEKLEKKFNQTINKLVSKIDNSISSFRFNVTIAHFYELYNFFKDNLDKEISNKVLKDSIMKIMKLMIPFVPHLAHECLEFLGCKSINKWPNIETNIQEEIKLAVQINGKTRDIINVNKDLVEKEIKEIILKSSKAKKYIENKKIDKTIFIKNKIVNYIVKD